MLQFLGVLLVAIEYVLKIVAIGAVPENRNPSSSSAWLLLILLVPVVGFPLYWIMGSPWVRGRRMVIQDRANHIVAELTADYPDIPAGAEAPVGLHTILAMNRKLTGMPATTGVNLGLFDDTDDLVQAIINAVENATKYVNVQFYILTLDETTTPLVDALEAACSRGVKVRVLADHMGSRKYPGWKALQRRLADANIEFRLMLPVKPLRGVWQRPDLRNHRKLLIVDGKTAFVGSHNLIHPAYGSHKNEAIGRHWHDLSLALSGDIVHQVEAVFAMDWFLESGERIDSEPDFFGTAPVITDDRENVFQLVPSGPGYPTEPNLRMFTSLIHKATERVEIVSPYFVPDEALLAAITTAALRGVEVELFVGEESDQFLVGHAQRSFYRALLETGVRIYLYPAPQVLHSKYLTIDDHVGVIGSSNMDYRSFALNYETMLLGFGGDLVTLLLEYAARYRSMSRELTLEEWLTEPWHRRYIDNVARLTAAVM